LFYLLSFPTRRSSDLLSCSKFIFNSLLKDRTSDVPVVASYCATFLKPEMLHIYRQITALRRVRPVVVAQKLENQERFPFRDIHRSEEHTSELQSLAYL